MESDIDILFQKFIERVDRDMLAKKAERVLKDKASHGGGMFVFTNSPDGLIGFTIRKMVVASVQTCCRSDFDELVSRLVEFYGFPADWVPPRLLVREVLALTVHRRRITERLQRDLGKSVDLVPVFDRAAATIRCVDDAYLLDDERTDSVLEELWQVK
jgi:hypothetical protein